MVLLSRLRYVAVIVTIFCEVTALWVTVKVPEVEPAGIVMALGTVTAEVKLLLNITLAPPVGAGTSRVTVPVTAVAEPPLTGLLLNVMLTGDGGCIVQ
jgi:hypothetical protein